MSSLSARCSLSSSRNRVMSLGWASPTLMPHRSRSRRSITARGAGATPARSRSGLSVNGGAASLGGAALSRGKAGNRWPSLFPSALSPYVARTRAAFVVSQGEIPCRRLSLPWVALQRDCNAGQGCCAPMSRTGSVSVDSEVPDRSQVWADLGRVVPARPRHHSRDLRPVPGLAGGRLPASPPPSLASLPLRQRPDTQGSALRTSLRPTISAGTPTCRSARAGCLPRDLSVRARGLPQPISFSPRAPPPRRVRAPASPSRRSVPGTLNPGTVPR